jgi:hypothetical protein
MCAFWVELKEPEKNFIIIIANGIKQTSVLYLKAIWYALICDPAFVLIKFCKAS